MDGGRPTMPGNSPHSPAQIDSSPLSEKQTLLTYGVYGQKQIARFLRFANNIATAAQTNLPGFTDTACICLRFMFQV